MSLSMIEVRVLKQRRNPLTTCRLRDLPVGETAEVLRINTDNRAYRTKLLSMGLTRGTQVQVKRIAPFGDPVLVSVRGYDLSLRKHEADAVELTLTNDREAS